MNILLLGLLFLVVIVALILVHEFGHFVAAKLFKMRVDEFGIGYPPRAWGVKRGETEYTLNWLPFGGFVRIYGEDAQAAERDVNDANRAFYTKPRLMQATVLVAGIVMNIAFAWLLLSLTLAIGAPRALSDAEIHTVPDAAVFVANVLPDSPADEAGFLSGDRIISVTRGEDVFTSADAAAFTSFVSSEATPLEFTISRNGVEQSLTATPEAGLSPTDPERLILGVGVSSVGTIKTPWYRAPVEGLTATWNLTQQTALGLVQFFAGVFTLTADLSQVSGPVGIAGAVGDASANGLAQLLTLTAIISINLALINLLPIPALDGGRLLFVIIESIIRKPLPRSFQIGINALGFGFLLLLMLVITASDIFKIVT